MDRPRLNIQPWLDRLGRVAGATVAPGQLVADMVMQVFIERKDVYHDATVTGNLYVGGRHYFESEYPDGLMADALPASQIIWHEARQEMADNCQTRRSQKGPAQAS